jgi:hypothetical protein
VAIAVAYQCLSLSEWERLHNECRPLSILNKNGQCYYVFEEQVCQATNYIVRVEAKSSLEANFVLRLLVLTFLYIMGGNILE